jgi:hypothetical protein
MRTKGKKETCATCHGRGWLLSYNVDREIYEIEKCDTCDRFDSDRHAGDAAAPIIEATLALADLVIRSAVEDTRRRKQR